MKKTIISLEAFNNMLREGFVTTKNELYDCLNELSNRINHPLSRLVDFNETTVIFETYGGEFVRCMYVLRENDIEMSDFERLEIDTDSLKEARREKIRAFLGALNKNDSDGADSAFDEVMSTLYMKDGNYRMKHGDKNKRKRPHMKKESFNKDDLNGIDLDLLDDVAKEIDPNHVPYRSDAYWKSIELEDDKVTVNRIHQRKLEAAQRKQQGATVRSLHDARQSAHDFLESEDFSEAVINLKRSQRSHEPHAVVDIMMELVNKQSNLVYANPDKVREHVEKALDESSERGWDSDMVNEIASGVLRMAHELYLEKVNIVLDFAKNMDLFEKHDGNTLKGRIDIIEDFFNTTAKNDSVVPLMILVNKIKDANLDQEEVQENVSMIIKHLENYAQDPKLVSRAKVLEGLDYIAEIVRRSE